MTDISIDEERKLSGEVEFDFPSLNWVESFIPYLESPAGALQGQLVLSGNTQRPIIQSNIQLLNGSMSLPELGIALSEMSLNLTSDDANHFVYAGALKSGDGQLTLHGAVNEPFLPSRFMKLQLMGDSVEVLNLPNRYLSLTPQLEIDLNEERGSVNGEIYVPRFNLVLDQLSLKSSKVSTSQDVYVVRPQNVRSNFVPNDENVRNIPIQGKVSVQLGEDISFSGNGLSLSLAGGLTVEQQDSSRPMQAFGELVVTEGLYEMYGQSLMVNNGHLFFIGNPANPALDIQATRTVQEMTVGVQIGGMLDNIRSQLFSSPVLPDSEVLAMLITGKTLGKANDTEGNSMLAAITNLGI